MWNMEVGGSMEVGGAWRLVCSMEVGVEHGGWCGARRLVWSKVYQNMTSVHLAQHYYHT